MGAVVTIEEFAKLKVGDKIANYMAGLTVRGVVTSVDDKGVSVCWGDGGAPATRHYAVVGTIWTHWDKLEE